MSDFTVETVESYEDFKRIVPELEKKDKPVLVLFEGNDMENGTNWCPDCRELDAVLKDLRPEVEKSSAHFVRVKVGAKDEWKSPNSPFRTDETLKLHSIPTIMTLKTKEKESDLKELTTHQVLLSKFGL